MATSQEWRDFFAQNARSLLEIPWHLGPELTAEESAAIAQSLNEFQAGESSEGKHLFRYGQEYADRTGDHVYVDALKLFIAEEHRHARDLGQFMMLHDIPLVRTTFPDRVFRRMRHLFGGLEKSIAVLITAEIIAKVYYAALREATQSEILRRLCDQILRDEQKHVEFQSEQLAKLRAGHGSLRMSCTMALQRFLFWGTTLVVWYFHRKALRRGGFGFWRYWQRCWCEFEETFAVPSPKAAVRQVAQS